MSDTAIKVVNLGKKYRINPQENSAAFPTLREDLVSLFKFPRRRGKDGNKETLWALRDISFEVRKGEVLGLIGRNGSGKTTLLKILAGITKPTKGYAEIYGRSGSLLEVGTGFHSELSGRENVYISGNILGMSQAEIRRKFDEIVAFSEIEKFIDTPVKRYSSGMRVRLGFSVAAFFDPEILLIDEVLAVGDAAFRKKCLNKMREITREGRTVLFVSHSMSAVDFLCERAILLEEGNMQFNGPASEAIKRYLHEREITYQPSFVDLSNTSKRSPRFEKIFSSLRLLNARGEESVHFHSWDDIVFEVALDSKGRLLKDQDVQINVIDSKNTPIAKMKSYVMMKRGVDIQGKVVFRCVWKQCPLVAGNYTVNLRLKGVDRINSIDHIDDVIGFQVVPPGPLEEEIYDTYPGAIIPTDHWEVSPAE